MKLTKAQIAILPILKKATKISCGVIWHVQYEGRNRIIRVPIDGRVCNALVTKGILVKIDGTGLGETGEYTLNLKEE